MIIHLYDNIFLNKLQELFISFRKKGGKFFEFREFFGKALVKNAPI
jgi:hypothetical protein